MTEFESFVLLLLILLLSIGTVLDAVALKLLLAILNTLEDLKAGRQVASYAAAELRTAAEAAAAANRFADLSSSVGREIDE